MVLRGGWANAGDSHPSTRVLRPGWSIDINFCGGFIGLSSQGGAAILITCNIKTINFSLNRLGVAASLSLSLSSLLQPTLWLSLSLSDMTMTEGCCLFEFETGSGEVGAVEVRRGIRETLSSETEKWVAVTGDLIPRYGIGELAAAEAVGNLLSLRKICTFPAWQAMSHTWTAFVQVLQVTQRGCNLGRISMDR